MELISIKHPEFENDDSLLLIKSFYLDESLIENIRSNDKYINLRFKKFENKDITPNGYEIFSDRLSLRNIKNVSELTGNVYTHAISDRNNVEYEKAIDMIREMLIKNIKTRRAMLRITNSIKQYHKSEIKNDYDVSCLSLIHYLEKSARLVFRSSDIKDELFSDLITIYWFFLRPIYSDPISISIYASTAQNIEYIDHFIDKVKNL